MKTNLSKQKNVPHPADEIKKAAVRVGLLAALCAMPLNSALADFSNVECKDFYGYASVSGYTNIAGNNYANNASISVTRNNLSNSKGYINVAAAVLEWQPNVGYGVGPVRVFNGSSGTMQAITSDSGSWVAGFWADQIYGDPNLAELTVDNYGTMNGQAQNSVGSAFGFHNYTLYGGMNMTNQAGATCSATARGSAVGIDSWCYYGPLNFLNNGTATGTSSGHGAEVDPRGIFLMTYDSTNRAPIYCENNGYISATSTGGETNYTYGAWVWAQGGDMRLINRGTMKGTSWGGAMGQAVGVYCGSNVGDDWVVNTGQMIAEGAPGWALGIENDDNNNWLGHIYVLNSGVISNGVTSGQACCGIYGGVGIVLWVSSGPTFITNTATGKIYGGNLGIAAGVYGGPITIYNSGEIYGGGGDAFHLGSGDDRVYLNGTGKVTGVMDGGSGNNSLIFNLDGTLQYVNGNAANSGPNLSAYGLGTSGSIVVSGKTYSWRNFNVSGTVTAGVADGTYKLIARHSGKAMEAYNSGTGNGTQIDQWTYGGGANQQWIVSGTGNGDHKIIGVQSGKSLDIDYSSGGTANGTKVQLWDYWNGPSQQFRFAATDSGYYRITPNCATGSCLDVAGISTSDGAAVHLWQWLNGNNQQWLFQPVDGTYKLIAQHSGKAMDAAGYGTTNGTQIQQWTYSGGSNQRWTITDTGSGNYKIIGVQSGKSLDIYNGNSANQTKVELWDFWGGSMQQFKFTLADTGYYRITPNCATGSCLDVDGISTASGAKVQLWQWLNGDNQKWAVQNP